MVSQFKTGNHGELFYMLLILKKVQCSGLGLSFHGESIPGQKTVWQRKQKTENKKNHGLWNQVDMVGSTALSLISCDLS